MIYARTSFTRSIVVNCIPTVKMYMYIFFCVLICYCCCCCSFSLIHFEFVCWRNPDRENKICSKQASSQNALFPLGFVISAWKNKNITTTSISSTHSITMIITNWFGWQRKKKTNNNYRRKPNKICWVFFFVGFV